MSVTFEYMVARVRAEIGYAEPVSGGDDPMDESYIVDDLNDALRQMVDAIYGLEAYCEFDITSAGVITINVPATNKPTVAKKSPAITSYDVYSISDARSYINIENLTSNVSNTIERELRLVNIENPFWQTEWQGSGEYYGAVALVGFRGFVLLPKTITVTNTIGVTYRKNYVANALSSVTFTDGGSLAGTNDLTLSGSFLGSTDTNYVVKIDAAGTPGTYKWSSDGGTSWRATGKVPTGSATELEYGIYITIPNNTAHGLNDSWAFSATAASVSQFSDEELRGYPMLTAQWRGEKRMQEPSSVWGATMQLAEKALERFLENRLTDDNLLDEDLSHPTQEFFRDYDA